jgi:hypothetical protein
MTTDAAYIVILESLLQDYSDHIFDDGTICCGICLGVAEAADGGEFWCANHVPDGHPDLVWRMHR